MRVLVAADAIAGLSPLESSERIAWQFDAVGAQVAVVPLASSGQDLARSIAGFSSWATCPVANLAELLERLVSSPVEDCYLDLTEMAVPDFEELIERVTKQLALRIAERWRAGSISALVTGDELAHSLTGVGGYLADFGHRNGVDLKQILASDDAAGHWLQSLGVADEAPVGALGEVGALLAASGIAVQDALECCVAGYGLEETAGQADLVVSGAQELDFHGLGGPVVRRLAQIAASATRPYVTIVGRNYVSARELRSVGIETAYPIVSRPGEAVTPEQLSECAKKVATTWRW